MNRFAKKRLFHAKSSAQGGKREDLGGLFVRSRWEANCARWLNELQRRGEVVKWAYEDTEFKFESIKRGTRFYRPDFHVWEPNAVEYFIEVKGFFQQKDVTTMTRMARHYPQVKVLIVDKKRYAEIESEFGTLENWER